MTAYRHSLLVLAVLLAFDGDRPFAAEQRFDVVVYGGTPGGIASAVAAARLGRSVALVEYHNHIGGMAASGLGKSDIENRAMIGGLFQEFVARVLAHYVKEYGAESENVRLCHDGYYAEPSVVERIFEAMVGEQSAITVIKGRRLQAATVEKNRLRSIEVVDRSTGSAQMLTATVFIDGTYEGDLYAKAGAEFRVGREARAEFDEPHAGVVYFDYQTHEFLPGSTGEADDRLPAYTYRLCLTTDPANSYRLTSPPPGYDRNVYVGYFDDLKSGRFSGPKVFKPGRGYNPAHFDTMVRVFSVTDIPNRKTDVNINPRALNFPFSEENRGYLEGDDVQRQRICERHRNLTLGLLWFIQNDPEVSEKDRKLANGLHLPLDEFTDTGHFPFHLYVREGRRLVGEYTLTEHDITQNGGDRSVYDRPDSIAVGEFPIDSFPARKRQPGDVRTLEGYLGMLDYITRPYEIPYRIMIPKRLDGVIVPVAASTTHVGFSSIRMEPTWMALGQAAGVAAHLALEHETTPRRVPMAELQQILARQGQVLKHVEKSVAPAEMTFERHTVMLGDDATLSYAVRKGTGPTLVLVPGSFDSVESWKAVVENLAPDLQVVVVELRGHGESWPPPTAATGTIEQFARDVLEVTRSAGLKPFYVGGHSIGGMVAIECAGQQPQRLKGVIAIEGWTRASVLQAAFQGNIDGTLSAAQKARKYELRRPTTKRWSAEQTSAFAQIWTKWNGTTILERASLPVLELWGDRGAEQPSRALMQIPDRSNIELQWVTGASHFLPLERPQETAKAMQDFIRKVEKTGQK